MSLNLYKSKSELKKWIKITKHISELNKQNETENFTR